MAGGKEDTYNENIYEGSTVVHNTPLLPGQVKVGVEEVTDVDAPVPVPTDEVSLVGQTIHTFLSWSFLGYFP